jgi:hypothetical protein
VAFCLPRPSASAYAGSVARTLERIQHPSIEELPLAEDLPRQLSLRSSDVRSGPRPHPKLLPLQLFDLPPNPLLARGLGVGTETPVGVMYGVNLGCLEDVSDEELSRIPITYVDGRNDRFAAPDHFSHL